jgi:haloacid dehalogenase-like hydrolase/Phage integrase family
MIARRRTWLYRLPGQQYARVLRPSGHRGQGAGVIDGRKVAVGNAILLDDVTAASAELASKAAELRRDGASVIFVAVHAQLAGIIAVADPIKPTTASALDRLWADGIRIVMVTGDSRTTAQAVASRLGINEIEADDIRRTYGSWLVAGGAPLHAVRDLLGHGDVRTTSIYLATARQDLRDAIEALPKIPGQGRVKKKAIKSNADRNTGGVDGAGL